MTADICESVDLDLAASFPVPPDLSLCTTVMISLIIAHFWNDNYHIQHGTKKCVTKIEKVQSPTQDRIRGS